MRNSKLSGLKALVISSVAGLAGVLSSGCSHVSNDRAVTLYASQENSSGKNSAGEEVFSSSDSPEFSEGTNKIKSNGSRYGFSFEFNRSEDKNFEAGTRIGLFSRDSSVTSYFPPSKITQTRTELGGEFYIGDFFVGPAVVFGKNSLENSSSQEPASPWTIDPWGNIVPSVSTELSNKIERDEKVLLLRAGYEPRFESESGKWRFVPSIGGYVGIAKYDSTLSESSKNSAEGTSTGSSSDTSYNTSVWGLEGGLGLEYDLGDKGRFGTLGAGYGFEYNNRGGDDSQDYSSTDSSNVFYFKYGFKF